MKYLSPKEVEKAKAHTEYGTLCKEARVKNGVVELWRSDYDENLICEDCLTDHKGYYLYTELGNVHDIEDLNTTSLVEACSKFNIVYHTLTIPYNPKL